MAAESSPDAEDHTLTASAPPSGRVQLASFDVFGALLTRAVGCPRSSFLLLGRLPEVRAITSCTPEEFAETRIAAEDRARLGRSAISLHDIYRELAVSLALDETAAAALQSAETELERRLSRPVPGVGERLDAAKHLRRVAVADTALSADAVAGLLKQHQLLEHIDAVYTSSDLGASKSSGALYLRVLSIEGALAQDWQHVGDDADAAGSVPRLIGAAVAAVSDTAPNRYEEIWESHRHQTGGFTSLIAGASRLTRLAIEADGDARPIVDVTAAVAAPILTAYVLWVMHTAVQEGNRRLYFMARDGEILYLIAERLAARLGLDLDLHYLYGSRSVYHRAGLAHKPLEEAAWAWSARYRMTPVAVLKRLGLTDDEALEAAKRLSLPNETMRLTADSDILRRMLGDPTVVTAVRSRARKLLARVHGYLRQEGLGDGTPFAIVDTGWAGRIAAAFSDVLPEDTGGLRRGYLFGYKKEDDGCALPDVLRGYLFDEYSQTGYQGQFKTAHGPLETFTVANHGMTTDFAKEATRYAPILASEENPTLEGWPWQLVRDTMFRFVDELVLDKDIARTGADLRAPVAAVLDEFWTRPTRSEAQSWSQYLYEDDILGQSRHPLAAPITVSDFFGKAHRSYEGRRMWMSGSVMLSSRSVRPAARVGLWLNDVRRSEEGMRSALPSTWRRAAILRRQRRARG
jgi:FMN phosphatase YigB (HAD superfamily)